MTLNWTELLCGSEVAVLCMEMQRGVLASQGPFTELVAAVEEGDVIGRGRQLLRRARLRDVPVLHCTAAFRADRAGTKINTPLVANLLKNPEHMLETTSAIEVIDEWWDVTDLECRRYHGLSPFAGTALDMTLRTLNVETLLVMGVSLNLGVTGLCIEAANLGYRVVLVADAVAGYPADYARKVIENTLSLIAAPMTVGEILEAWRSCE